MSIELEHDTLSNKYYIHDLIDGWKTAEISKADYERYKKDGISIDEKHKLKWR